MAVTGHKGVDVRQTGTRLLFRALFLDSTAATAVATGSVALYLFELQSDGTVLSYDFADDTFKSGALGTASLAMTHRAGNNGTMNTGIWTGVLSTLTGFTAGAMYLAYMISTAGTPAIQAREFQYGSGEGDLTVTSSGGVSLAATGLDAIAMTEFSGPANTWPKMLTQLWRRFIKMVIRDKIAGEIQHIADDNTTVLLTQAYSEDANTEEVGAGS